MKRLLCIMLILVMAFGATAPVYADAWTNTQADVVTRGTTGILSMLTQLRTDIVQWMTLTGAGGQGLGATFQDEYILLSHIADWLVPTGARGANDPTLLDSVVVLTNYAMNHLPDISVIAGYIGNWMTSNNNYLNSINQHVSLLDQQNFPFNSSNVGVYSIGADGTITLNRYNFSSASWYKFVILYLAYIHERVAETYKYTYNYLAKDYNSTLSVWDSQGDTLGQELFVPTSVTNGLYKYLAFLQRDVARMTFIIADPHEQAGMENANDSGVADMYADVYDSDNGGVTLSDMSDTFNTQKVAKQTFNTGVSFSTNGLFSFTDDGNWGFWSTAVKNDMDNVPMTRKSVSYDSTAYDEQLEELSSIWGIKDGK